MITVEEIKEMLQLQLPEAEIEVRDMTGTNDHFEVSVIWRGFIGIGLVDQHQMVNRALADPLSDGRIHALKIKTRAPKTV